MFSIPHLLSAGKVKTNNKRPYVGINGEVSGIILEKDNPLTYDEIGDLPPYDELGKDAETLQGHPADDFVLDTELTAALAGKADVNHNHDEVYAPASHTHEIGQITGLQGQLDGKAASSHTHAASQVTAGTFAGNVVAAANGNLGTKMVRNIYAGTSDIGAGSALAMGDIYLVYE